MTIEKNSFIIECPKEVSYVKEVIEYLESRMDEITLFLNLQNIQDKKKIVIWNDLNEYKKHIEYFFEYHDYMCADTLDGNVNMLTLEEAHKTREHKNMTLLEMKQNICHEFVHICQQSMEIEPLNENDHSTSWFWEALATNLGNPEQFESIKLEDLTGIENFNNMPNNYPIAFTLGKYMLENIDKDTIIEYIKYPKQLKIDSQSIFENAIAWSNREFKKM